MILTSALRATLSDELVEYATEAFVADDRFETKRAGSMLDQLDDLQDGDELTTDLQAFAEAHALAS